MQDKKIGKQVNKNPGDVYNGDVVINHVVNNSGDQKSLEKIEELSAEVRNLTKKLGKLPDEKDENDNEKDKTIQDLLKQLNNANAQIKALKIARNTEQYQTIQDLKRQVNSLEAEIKARDAEFDRFRETNKPKRNLSSANSIIYDKSKFEIDETVLKKYIGSGGEVKIPEGITSISFWAFSGCKTITDVIFPNSVKLIDSNAFSGCINLKSVKMSNNINFIGSDAFRGCASLPIIHIPIGVISIGGRAFSDCTNLKIYCAHKKQPEYWVCGWNGNCPVVWGSQVK